MNIRVPPIGEGRTSQHRERYVMARFLATAYTQGIIEVPISIDHRDNTENPDFCLSIGDTRIGAECVEVVSQESYAIKAIRRRKFQGAMTFLHRFEPKEHVYSKSQQESIASGSAFGTSWVGDAPEREWADAHAYFIKNKVQKLRNGNYKPLDRIWLLMQDEWPVPVITDDEKMLAFSFLQTMLPCLLAPPSFERVFICSNSILFDITATECNFYPLENWWQ